MMFQRFSWKVYLLEYSGLQELKVCAVAGEHRSAAATAANVLLENMILLEDWREEDGCKC
jgi:hypothetical protein